VRHKVCRVLVIWHLIIFFDLLLSLLYSLDELRLLWPSEGLIEKVVIIRSYGYYVIFIKQDLLWLMIELSLIELALCVLNNRRSQFIIVVVILHFFDAGTVVGKV
jgi:hypothetical protein